MILAAWLALLPLRLLAALGLRRGLILACLFVLAVTAYGVAEDLGLLDPPAKPARPAGRPASQAGPSAAARADIPTGYLTLYRRAASRCPGLTWAVLAAVGKVESDHGRSPLPGVRSGWNPAGAAGPMQFGIGVGRAGNAWARYGNDFDRDGRRSVYDPGDAIPAAASYLCAAGAPRRLDRALYTTANPKEVNRMRCPSLEELRRQLKEDGGCEAIDGALSDPTAPASTTSCPGCWPSASSSPPTLTPRHPEQRPNRHQHQRSPSCPTATSG